jgi:hypothetical protein
VTRKRAATDGTRLGEPVVHGLLASVTRPLPGYSEGCEPFARPARFGVRDLEIDRRSAAAQPWYAACWLTPFVMHVAARTIATHVLSIFGDHST